MMAISLIILVPIVTGIILLVIPERGKNIKSFASLFVSALSAFWAWEIFSVEPLTFTFIIPGFPLLGEELSLALQGLSQYLQFRVDALSQLTVIFTGLFAPLVALYSLIALGNKERFRNFESYFLITLGLAFATFMADNLLLFIFLWGALAITLYKHIPSHDPASSAAAKKTLIMIGSSDGIMIAGIAILYSLTGSFNISEITVETNSTLTYFAFIALIIGSFTKAGAFPFHSWVPDFTKEAPPVSSAYLPAALDKLLGIYFLVRICHDLFMMSDIVRLIIIVAGIISILIAVMMALIQHDYKKVLGFHAVSQVGYMVLGIGLGNVVGLAAGLFHMINNAIFKSGLFFISGNIKNMTGKSKLDQLGGLWKKMPVTFLCGLVFALSVSGIPPFNGYISKSMIYQGIIDFGSGNGLANNLWMLWLVLAVLGSALTLVNFIKLIGSAFFGKVPDNLLKTREISPIMWLPSAILAIVCILTGVFAKSWVMPNIIFPATGPFETYTIWYTTFATIALGIFIYLILATGGLNRINILMAKEKVFAKNLFSVTVIYNTVSNAPVLSKIFDMANNGTFDIYHICRKPVFYINEKLSLMHDGVLQTYLSWVIAGLIILLIIL